MAEETVIRVMSNTLKGQRSSANMPYPRLRRFFWISAWGTLILIIMSSLSNPLFDEFDKLLHFTGYFILTSLFSFAQRGWFILFSWVAILLLSLSIEGLQAVLGRSPDLNDMISNCYGILAGGVFGGGGRILLTHFKAEMSTLLSQKRTRSFKKGEKIFSQGASAKYLYVVLEGEVLIYRKENGERRQLDIVTAGEVFGELGLITEDSRYASARAKSNCSLFVMSKEELFYQYAGNQHPAILVVQTLARRLQESNARIVELSNKN